LSTLSAIPTLLITLAERTCLSQVCGVFYFYSLLLRGTEDVVFGS
jgi:hypothetical protein